MLRGVVSHLKLNGKQTNDKELLSVCFRLASENIMMFYIHLVNVCQ